MFISPWQTYCLMPLVVLEKETFSSPSPEEEVFFVPFPNCSGFVLVPFGFFPWIYSLLIQRLWFYSCRPAPPLKSSYALPP
jgi:hypothetical protein